MRIALAILAAMLAAPFVFAADHVVISEVYYDPVSTETGGECIELYNPTDSSVDIGGWIVITESSATDATVPAGTFMPPHSYYLIADSGWSVSKDDPSWPDADHEEPITLTNSDAGVALSDPGGTVIDAVGWGDPAGISPGLYEGTPSALAPSGSSLRRADLVSDSDDNSLDFASSVPDLQNSDTVEGSGGQPVNISVEISNSAPQILSVTVLDDEDPLVAGSQLSPMPGDDRAVEVTAMVSDPDGTSSLSVNASFSGNTLQMDWLQDVNSTAAEYSAVFYLPFYQAPGNYTVLVEASDLSLSSQASTWFDFQEMVAISIDSSALHFQGASVGQFTELLGDEDTMTDGLTVSNIGNSVLDMGVYGSDLVDGGNSISISNIKYSFDNDFASPLSGTLSTVADVIGLGLYPGQSSMTGLGLQLYIPPGTREGSYEGAIFLSAVGG